MSPWCSPRICRRVRTRWSILPHGVSSNIKLGGVHSDAIARFFSGRVYVVNRLEVDSIQILARSSVSSRRQTVRLSVGRYQCLGYCLCECQQSVREPLRLAKLLIIDPATLRSTGELDLSRLVKPTDSDGSPDPAYADAQWPGVCGPATYRCQATITVIYGSRGEVAVIDPIMDRIVSVITLNGKNPISEFHLAQTSTVFSSAQWAIWP